MGLTAGPGLGAPTTHRVCMHRCSAGHLGGNQRCPRPWHSPAAPGTWLLPVLAAPQKPFRYCRSAGTPGAVCQHLQQALQPVRGPGGQEGHSESHGCPSLEQGVLCATGLRPGQVRAVPREALLPA